MALILEIKDRRGVTTWHPLNGEPVSIGRGLANDIILDDPYVDAEHLRIVPDESGGLTVRDLGSVNGVLANGTRIIDAIAANAGSELRIGETTLRFRDRNEVVPPALVASTEHVPWLAARLMTRGGSIAITSVTLAFTALYAWLGSTERSTASTVMAAVMVAAGLLAVWAGIWTLMLRGAGRRFQFRGHVAVAAAAALVIMLYGTLNDWLTFLFPDVRVFAVAYSIVAFVVIALVVVGHLTVAGVQAPRRRWQLGWGLSVSVFLLTLTISLAQEDKFSDSPKFPAQLKPVPAGMVPTKTVDDFVKAMEKARTQADKAIKP